MVGETKVNGKRPPPRKPTVARHLGILASDLLTLGELQAQLFAADLREGVRRTRVAASLCAAAIVVSIGAIPLLLGAAALALADAAGWSLALALFAVAAAALAVATACGLLALRRARQTTEVFRESLHEMKRNLSWAKASLAGLSQTDDEAPRPVSPEQRF